MLQVFILVKKLFLKDLLAKAENAGEMFCDVLLFLKPVAWGQYHETKLNACFLSTWEETNAQPENIEKSFNKSSEKFCLVEFSSEFLTLEIKPLTRSRSYKEFSV